MACIGNVHRALLQQHTITPFIEQCVRVSTLITYTWYCSLYYHLRLVLINISSFTALIVTHNTPVHTSPCRWSSLDRRVVAKLADTFKGFVKKHEIPEEFWEIWQKAGYTNTLHPDDCISLVGDTTAHELVHEVHKLLNGEAHYNGKLALVHTDFNVFYCSVDPTQDHRFWDTNFKTTSDLTWSLLKRCYR